MINVNSFIVFSPYLSSIAIKIHVHSCWSLSTVCQSVMLLIWQLLCRRRHTLRTNDVNGFASSFFFHRRTRLDGENYSFTSLRQNTTIPHMRYYYVSLSEWAVIKWFLFFLKFPYFARRTKKKLIMNTLSLMRIISWSKAAAVRYSASCLLLCFLLRRKFRFRHERIHIHRQRIQHFWDLSWATTEQHKKLSYLFLFLIIFCSYY